MHAMQTHSIASVLPLINVPDLQENFCEVMLYCIFNATGSPVAYISKFATKIVIFGELWAMSVAVSAKSVETQFVTER